MIEIFSDIIAIVIIVLIAKWAVKHDDGTPFFLDDISESEINSDD